MRKKFVSAMAFGAMILASSPVLVSCSDYDDDIDRLQNQVDGIKGENPVTPAELQAALDAAKADYQAALELALTGKADNAAVQALQAKVNELNDALNGKADAATVQGILNDIRTLSEEVNSVKGGLDGVKSELQGEIDALKDKIAGVESGAATKAELKAQLDAAVAELNAKIAAADNTADIEALNGKLTELKNAQDALSGKLDADKTELTGKIADALAKAEEAAAKAGDAATKAEVEALKSKVDALEGTVSNADLNEIKSQLADVTAKLADAATKSELAGLQSQIDELTAKPSLTEADVRSLIQAELTSSLTDLNNKMVQVENSISNNARAITELTQKIAKIAEIESTLTDYESRLALVESGKASKQDLSDLATRVGTLETSMQGLSETIGSYLTTNSYAKLSDIDSKLSTQLASYYTKGEVDQAIQNKINAAKQLTEAQQKAVQEVFANLDTEAEGFKTYAELLGEVATLNAKFAEDGDVAALETGLSDLDKKFNEFVNSANTAIQSIVFMPENVSRSVMFRSLVLTASNKYIPITSTKEDTIRFRVTPAAAAKNLAENYDLKFLGHKQTRAIGGNEFIKQVEGTDIKVDEDGVVTIKVTTGSANTTLDRSVNSHYSSICLQATAKDKKDGEGNVIDGVMRADLTSDYFTLGVTKRNVTKVSVRQDAAPDPSIEYNKEWSWDYKAGRKFYDQNGYDLSDFDMENVGTVTYSSDNSEQFSLNPSTGVLTFKEKDKVSSIGKDVMVTATYQFKADNVNTSLFNTVYTQLNIVRAVDNKQFTIDAGAIDWTVGKTITLNMRDVQNATGLSRADFVQMQLMGSETAKSGRQTLQITGDLTSGLNVVIPAYINMKTAVYTTNIKDENGNLTPPQGALRRKYKIDDLHTFEIIVTMPAESNFPEVKIERNPNWWTGDNMTVSAINDTNPQGKITGVKLQFLDYLTQAFSNYKSDGPTYATQGLDYSVSISKPLPLGVRDDYGTISVDKSTYRGATIGIEAVVKLNENLQQTAPNAVQKSDKGSIVVPNLSGEWNVGKTAFTKDGQLTGSINLAEGCTWTSRDGHVMWKDGQLYTTDNTNAAIANAAMFATSPMDIYGLEAPKFEVVSGTDPDRLVAVNQNTGMLTFTSKADNFVLAKDYVIKVKVTVKSQWGKYANWKNNVNEGVTKEITLTLKKQ